ncbi:hypothetical protein [Streptomyces sp.]|uniref:hypothetical protein n=1 Tax=Streptomyces sp. TaxID=1931 RepID=UPI002F3E5847
MTGRIRGFAVLPAVALAALLVAGCGQDDRGGASPGSTPSAPSVSDLAHLRQLVDDADSAAAAAESDAAADK